MGKCIQVFVKNLKGREDLEDLSIEGKLTKKQGMKMWIVFMWLRIGSSGGHL
jgi:hypothetical protein